MLFAAVGALLLVAMLVVRTSQAAFVATTTNEGNSFNAGSVTLTDDDAGNAMFEVTGMVPGEDVVECIEVSYEGSFTQPQEVRLYSGGYAQVLGPESGSQGLGDYLLLTVEVGDGGEFEDCGGFTPATGPPIVAAETLADFGAATDYAGGVDTWTPSSTGDSRTFRFTVELAEDTPDTEQGAGVSDAVFVWEVRS